MAVKEDMGEIKISNEVVGTIASLAAMEVDGIVSLGPRFSIGEMLGKKDVDKGVTVSIEGSKVIVNVEVRVEYGVNIYEAAHRLQKRIKDAVEQMTGLAVEKVNVIIKGLSLKEPAKKPLEEEESKGVGSTRYLET